MEKVCRIMNDVRVWYLWEPPNIVTIYIKFAWSVITKLFSEITITKLFSEITITKFFSWFNKTFIIDRIIVIQTTLHKRKSDNEITRKKIISKMVHNYILTVDIFILNFVSIINLWY